jgi:stage V sporulation protein SpoVS
MSNIQIPNLPAVTALSGEELLEGVQAGSSVKISLGQIIAASAIGTPLSFPFPISIGGTGATTASDARTNLGLGTIAIQDADAVVITGGSINGTTIGGITPAAGTFTTGTFTTGTFGLGAVGTPSVTFTGDTNTGIWSPAADTIAISTSGVERMRIDPSGDVGVSVIPSAWGNSFAALEVGTTASISSYKSAVVNALSRLETNSYSDGTNYRYKITREAGAYQQYNGSHQWFNAPSGTAGNVITFTQAMTMDTSGNLGIGTTTPQDRLQVSGGGAIAQSVQAIGTPSSFVTAQGIMLHYAAGVGSIRAYSNNSGSGTADINFITAALERFRVGSAGQWGIGGANYGTSGQTFISGGAGAAPAWGTLGLAGGGTGVTTAPAAAAVMYGYTSTATAAGTTVLTNTSSQYQLFTGVTTQTITLPVTSTLTTGWTFHIVNNSTGNLTVNSSGANLVATIPANMTLMVTCILTSGTTAASWEWGFTDFGSITGTGSVVLGTGPTITNGALNGTVGATTPSTGAFTTVTASTSVLSNGAGGIGYSTGAGVAVTQPTSRTTPAPTTGNKTSGAITLFSAAGVAGWTTFTVPNTAVAITDTIILTVRGNTNTYVAAASTIIAGTSFAISFNAVAGVAVDAPTINFNIIRGVSA